MRNDPITGPAIQAAHVGLAAGGGWRGRAARSHRHFAHPTDSTDTHLPRTRCFSLYT